MREARQRDHAENSPKPCIGGIRLAHLCRFCTADQMATITERGVPVHFSSQVSALRMSVGMGKMRWTTPQRIAHVTTTAQLSQCLAWFEARAAGARRAC